MINKIAKYILLLLLLTGIIVTVSLTFNAGLRRTVLFKAIAIHDFYQIKSLVKYVQVERRERNFSAASDHLLKYISLSKKISKEKSVMWTGVYDAVNYVASRATTQNEFNLLENVFLELVEMDPDLYKARVWLARAISDTNYKSALEHLEKAMEISPSIEDAYREAIKIAQERQDEKLAQKFCNKYMKTQLGGYKPVKDDNYFGVSDIRRMALEFSPENENPIFYLNTGIQLNNFQNYEFVPTVPVDMNGFNLYFSFLPGIRVNIKEISIYSLDGMATIPAQDFTAVSKSAYVDDNNLEGLSFLLVNDENEILSLRYEETFESVEKIIVTMNFARMKLVNKLLCGEIE